MRGPQGKTLLEIDLMSNRGDIILLNGPSGAGKSTLLRIVAGLVQPDQGMIRFEEETWYDDHENINLSPQERHIGFVFQDYALFPHLSAARNITFGLNDSGQAPSKLEHLLKWMELEEVREHPPGQLSGGQQQRVAIARALAVEPPLLLLDEPFSALDLTLRQKLAVELAEAVKTSGQTLILVSHDQSFILEKADRIWTLNEGKIEETIC